MCYCEASASEASCKRELLCYTYEYFFFLAGSSFHISHQVCNWAVFTAAELFSSWFDYKHTWAHLKWLPVVCFGNLQHPVTSSVRICFTYCFLKTKHSNGRSNLILLFYREKKNSLIQWRERIAWKKGELFEGKNRIICFEFYYSCGS